MRLFLTTAFGLLVLATSGCHAMGGSLRPSYGIVVVYGVAANSTEKYGIEAIANDGARLFGPARLQAQTKSKDIGTSSYGGAGVPQWVQVSWREPIRGQQIATTGKVIETLDFGKKLGDYRVEVASRIPKKVLKYASEGRGRAIRLTFRIKDDGVLLAWTVQETVRAPNGGTGRVYSLYGGDLSCDDSGNLIPKERCTSGYLKDAPWYNPSWIFE